MPPKRWVLTRPKIRLNRSSHPWGWAINMLRTMDWQTRKGSLERLKYANRPVYYQVITHLGPDEALEGTDIAPTLPPNMVIPLRDMDRRRYRQTRISDYFKKI